MTSSSPSTAQIPFVDGSRGPQLAPGWTVLSVLRSATVPSGGRSDGQQRPGRQRRHQPGATAALRRLLALDARPRGGLAENGQGVFPSLL